MKQEYFVVVLAHSLRGRLRRIHVPHTAVYAILALALVGCFSAFGFVASYARMAWKVANYNALKREADNLRARYQNLQKVVSETNVQMASLQLYANEVSVAYGIKEKLAGHRSRGLQPLTTSSPSLWPVEGRLMSGFAQRTDPFSGEGAFHKGVDISAPSGTPLRSAAGGVVVPAEPVPGGYGRLVIVDHGGGVQTYYAHMSKIAVHTGQEVHRGDTLGAVGSSGRVTEIGRAA